MVMMIMMMLTCRGIEGACTIGRAATQRYRSCQSSVGPTFHLSGCGRVFDGHMTKVARMTGGLLLLGTMLINEGATNVGRVLPSPSSQSSQAFAESHS